MVESLSGNRFASPCSVSAAWDGESSALRGNEAGTAQLRMLGGNRVLGHHLFRATIRWTRLFTMVRDPCKGDDEPQLRPIDVRFAYVVGCAPSRALVQRTFNSSFCKNEFGHVWNSKLQTATVANNHQRATYTCSAHSSI